VLTTGCEVGLFVGAHFTIALLQFLNFGFLLSGEFLRVGRGLIRALSVFCSGYLT
jgi:hypothetical protein